LEPERLAFLSGPTFAREVAQGLPTDVVVASKGMVAARKVQDLVHSITLRTYTSADPVGVQVGGAVKNVMAVATGACDGLRFGLNARAALITRGLAEMTRLGRALGADPPPILGPRALRRPARPPVSRGRARELRGSPVTAPPPPAGRRGSPFGPGAGRGCLRGDPRSLRARPRPVGGTLQLARRA